MGDIKLTTLHEVHVIIAIRLFGHGRIVLSYLMPADKACDGVLIRHKIVSAA